MMHKTAMLSEDGVYRFELTRTWKQNTPRVCWIMLNPSTADAEVDDPTIRRCISFSQGWGYGGLVVVNLFAYRATDPKNLPVGEAIGPGNDTHILEALGKTHGHPIVAWGSHGTMRNRGPQVTQMLSARPGVSLMCLGQTKGGQPKHPLYVKGDTELQVYR